MPDNPPIPPHVLKQEGLKTSREWKTLKRRQAKELELALNEFRFGCARCPGYEEVVQLEKSIERLRETLSVKQWGR